MAQTKIAAFFDVDGTLLRGASTWYLARDLFSRGYFGLKYIGYASWYAAMYVLFGENKKRINKIRKHSLDIIKGKLESDLALIGEELYDRFLQERIFPGALKIIQNHLDAGHEVWLVSATPQEISKQMAHRLGLTGGLGTVIEVNENGQYTGRLPGELLHGKTKALAVRNLAKQRNLDLKNCFAYSDSMSDIPLFATIGHPRVVNPEAKLRRLAAKRHWPIYEFARRQPQTVLAAHSNLFRAMTVGTVWTAKVAWRYILRRIVFAPVRLWGRLKQRR